MPTAAIGPAIGGVTSLLGGILGSGAANDASAKLAGTLGQNANQLAGVGHQQLQYELNQLTPYLKAGQQGENTLASLLSTPGQGLLQPYQSFQAPTGVNYQNDPGYQFRLQQGVNALQNSAAARGDLLSGNTLQSLTQLGQDYGSNEYQNVYNRALNTYGTNAQNFYQGQANTYNRLAGQAGMGMQATGEAQNARQFYQGLYGNAMNMSNQGAGAAASGIMGSANAWQNALGGIGGFGMNLAGLLGQGGNQMSPYFGNMTPGMISGAYGGPTQAPITPSNQSGYIPYIQ